MHPKLAALEARLRLMLDRLDHYLEDTYGELFLLHPNRLSRGAASSPSYDGLFTVHAKFSLGYGSRVGRGYVLNISLSTLERVPPARRAAIEEDAVQVLRNMIPDYFPERNLRVEKEGSVYKIAGDFSLGSA